MKCPLNRSRVGRENVVVKTKESLAKMYPIPGPRTLQKEMANKYGMRQIAQGVRSAFSNKVSTK